MPMKESEPKMTNDNSDDAIKYLKALVMLQVQSLNKPEDQLKPEILLTRAGLTAREIADILGKKAAAVAKVIQRSKVAA